MKIIEFTLICRKCETKYACPPYCEGDPCPSFKSMTDESEICCGGIIERMNADNKPTYEELVEALQNMVNQR